MRRLVFAGLLLGSVVVYATDEVFDVTMRLLADIVITENNALVFPDTPRGAANIVVLTTDAGAADFSATGQASTGFTKSIADPGGAITMLRSGGTPGNTPDEIVVDTFVLAGPVAFDATGNATGLKVGATAHVLAEDLAGDYLGTATFRMIY